MRIVHLCASDIGGGAARSAYRLHEGLRLIGVDSRMLVLHRLSSDSSVREFSVSHRLPARISRKVWRTWQGPFATSHRPLGVRSLEIFSTDHSPFGASVLQAIDDADVVNLHWVAGMFEFAGIAELSRQFPIVWTLHDMNPFTGGCHFDEGCGRFAAACGSCPQLNSQNANDVSAGVLSRKRSATATIDRDRLTVVGPSRWLTEESRRSAVLGQFPAVNIPYGLDTDVFQPRDPQVVRALMDIPPHSRVVLFLADGLSNRRKGFDLLLESLKGLEDLDNVFLLAVGGGLQSGDVALPVPVRVLPAIHDDRFLSFVYSAADVFAMASRADNLPNTILEALSCGTPVAGFDVGGVPDLVTPGKTGHLATPGATASLTAAIRRTLTSAAEMRSLCREQVLEHHTLADQAEKYLSIYSRVVGPKTGSTMAPAAAEMYRS
jgi:glycosyltransferase involved in cell wall biosynthesis